MAPHYKYANKLEGYITLGCKGFHESNALVYCAYMWVMKKISYCEYDQHYK